MEETKLVSSGLDAVTTLIEYLGKDAIGSEFLSEYINNRENQKANTESQKVALNQIVNNTADVGDAVNKIAERASKNNANLNDIYSEIDKLKNTVQKIEAEHKAYVQKFSELIQHTLDISKMVDDIQNISEQTNLLSFNASIEAAHAGAAGAGFRIIANEVKKLADNTRQTSEKIMNNVNLLKNSITTLESDTTKNNESLKGLAAETGVTLSKFETVRARNQKNNVEVKTISDAIAGNAEQIDGIIAQLQKNDDDNQKTVDFFADCASKNQMLFNDLYSFAYEIKAILEDLKK